jgi:hypothetical protein
VTKNFTGINLEAHSGEGYVVTDARIQAFIDTKS